MEPIEYFRILRRRWVIVVVATLLGAALGYITAPPAVSVEATRTYTATHTLYRDPGAVDNGVTMDTMALLATTGEIPRRVAKELNSSEEPAILATQVTVTPDQALGVLQVSATNNDGDYAARLANTFATETVEYFDERDAARQALINERLSGQLDEQEEKIRKLDRQISQTQGSDAELLRAERDALVRTYGFTVEQQQSSATQLVGTSGLVTLESAVPIPVAQGGFQAPQNRTGRAGLGALVAALLGSILAVAVDRLDVRIRTRRQAQAAFSRPVVAEIPKLYGRLRERHSIITADRPSSFAAESFRMLRLSLQLSGRVRGEGDDRRETQVVLVTSATPGEGKTTTAANIAASFAEIGKRVLVLDVDFRHPEQHRYFGVDRMPGISDFLSRRSEDRPPLSSLVQASALPGVSVVPNGTLVENPGELLSPGQDLIRQACAMADVVVVDAGPVLSVNDPIALMDEVDSVVLVARAGRTTAEVAHRASEVLTRADAPVVGVALIGVARSAATQPYYSQQRSAPVDPTWWKRRQDNRPKQGQEESQDTARQR